MGLPRRLLGRDEVVVRHMHTHLKTLFPAILLALLVIAAAVAALVLAPTSWPSWSSWVIAVVAAVLVVLVFGIPWLEWISSTYTITSRRIITRHGVFTKTGHDIPLSRISDVSYEHSLIDRLFGCGTLILQTSADDPLALPDIPDVEHVHVEVTELLFGDTQAAIDVDPDN